MGHLIPIQERKGGGVLQRTPHMMHEVFRLWLIVNETENKSFFSSILFVATAGSQ